MKVLIILPSFIPSTIIGILRPLAELENKGEIKLRLRLNNLPQFLSSDIDWCDTAVFCRNCEIKDLPVLYELKRKGKNIVYEIDDNFEEIPLTTEIGVYHRAFFRLHVLKRFFALSDISRVYSERMLQRSVKHGAQPQSIRSYFDKSLIKNLSKRSPGDVIRIAYPTGRIDDKDLEERFFSAVRIILEKYAGKVEFHLWRKDPPKQLSGVNGVVLNRGVKGYDNFIKSFFQAGFDIGLAPGINNPFFHSKTNNKYREFGGCGIAGVYSNFPPYSNSVTHEYSGLLVGNSTKEWAAAIERLVEDGNLRHLIVENAAIDVFDNYNFESSLVSWRECFLKLENHRPEPPEWLPTATQFPIFAAIHLGEMDKTDLRFEHLSYSLKGINNAILERFSNVNEYLQSNFRRTSCASVFFVNDESEVDTLSHLVSLSTSAIIDLSTYSSNMEVAIRDFLACASGIPISFLVTLNQANASTLIKTMPEYVQVIETSLSPIVHAFSLGGYPAAYLDLFERHIHHAPIKLETGRITRLFSKLRGIANYYDFWKSRLETLIMLIKWRIGFRQF